MIILTTTVIKSLWYMQVFFNTNLNSNEIIFELQ